MMPIYLEQRFQMLLNLAKEARYTEVARENVVAANEMVDTLFAVGMLTSSESMEYRALCAAVKVMIERKEQSRSRHKFPYVVQTITLTGSES